MNAAARVPLTLSPAGALLLKVTAFALMLLDHVDGVFYGGALGLHATVGRAVFPLFATLLAFNLSRLDAAHMLEAVAPRMLAFGLLAVPAYVYLYGAFPLNIMFTLAAAVMVCAMLQRGDTMHALAVLAIFGFFVDYRWFGLAAVVVPWILFRFDRPNWPAWFWAPTAVAGILLPINGSAWALLAVPVIALALRVDGNAPRFKWAFYAAYPLHFLALAVIRYAG